MTNPFDLVSLLAFGALAALFLQRSAAKTPDPIAMWKYAIAAAGCAGADVLGDHDQPILATIVLAATAIFAFTVLVPFKRGI